MEKTTVPERIKAARKRVLLKLQQSPVRATELTVPERMQLRWLEENGLIRYDEVTEHWYGV
jgi:hypothetical protein